MGLTTQTVYLASPVAVQNLLVSLYGYGQRWRRYGGDYARVVREVVKAEGFTLDEAERMQGAQLATVLRTARECSYYRKAWPVATSMPSAADAHKVLADLPVLRKESVREAPDDFRLPGATPFWVNHTSGSTGTPLVVGLDRYTYRLSMALLAQHESKYGIPPRARKATFAGRVIQPVECHRPPFWRYNAADRQMLFSTLHISEATIPAYIDQLERFSPIELIGYPSAIYALAEYCLRRNVRLRFRPRAVVTNSETLFEWQRDAIMRAFGCPVADYYGTAECIVFASQCPQGAYHFNPLLSVVEVLDDAGQAVVDGEQGRLVCTTLTNTVMPLVRYDLGDEVVRLTGRCQCGSELGGARRIVGRTDDNVITPSGSVVGRLDHIFKGATGVREAQIVQPSIGELIIRVVPGEGYNSSIASLLECNLRQRVGPEMKIEVRTVDSLERTKAGKFKGVIGLPSPSQRRSS